MARARRKSRGKTSKSRATGRGKGKPSSARKARVRRVSLKRISKMKGLTAGWA